MAASFYKYKKFTNIKNPQEHNTHIIALQFNIEYHRPVLLNRLNYNVRSDENAYVFYCSVE